MYAYCHQEDNWVLLVLVRLVSSPARSGNRGLRCRAGGSCRCTNLLMGIEIRLFLVIDAFSRLSGTLIACSAGLSLQLVKQLLNSTAAASGCGRGSVGAGVTAGPWRPLGKAPLTPRTTRFLVPANI